jgi:hypothetical protein
MNKIILLLSISLIVTGAYSQGSSSDTRTAKELKKDQKKAEMELAALSVDRMVANHQFFLEVTFMSDQSTLSAGMIDVRSQNNYIAVDADKILLQVEPNTYLTTNWGFTNTPVRGTCLKYKSVKSEKDGGYYIRFNTSGHIGVLSVTMNVSPSGHTELKLLKVNGESLTFQGTLKPLEQSRISAEVI